ncbi:MAG: hypothetical protein WCT32_02995 [Patescibacteria group bacterium]|jgi:hypothetical protein
MSKKKNKKFKKISGKVSTVTREDEAVELVEAGESSAVSRGSDAVALSSEADPRYKMIRRDVRRVLITVAALLIILFGTYILGLKTGALGSLGEWIYKIANIQSL